MSKIDLPTRAAEGSGSTDRPRPSNNLIVPSVLRANMITGAFVIRERSWDLVFEPGASLDEGADHQRGRPEEVALAVAVLPLVIGIEKHEHANDVIARFQRRGQETAERVRIREEDPLPCREDPSMCPGVARRACRSRGSRRSRRAPPAGCGSRWRGPCCVHPALVRVALAQQDEGAAVRSKGLLRLLAHREENLLGLCLGAGHPRRPICERARSRS